MNVLTTIIAVGQSFIQKKIYIYLVEDKVYFIFLYSSPT